MTHQHVPQAGGRQTPVEFERVDARDTKDRIDAVDRQQLGQVHPDRACAGSGAHRAAPSSGRRRHGSPGVEPAAYRKVMGLTMPEWLRAAQVGPLRERSAVCKMRPHFLRRALRAEHFQA